MFGSHVLRQMVALGLRVLILPQMPFVDPTAKQSTFQRFYHYQPFNRDFLTVTLRDQKLFCSDPHDVT